MSINREENGIAPPSFLPLAHSHNIALDGIVGKENDAVEEPKDTRNQLTISESEEDLINGNFQAESSKGETSALTSPIDEVTSLLENSNDGDSSAMSPSVTVQSGIPHAVYSSPNEDCKTDLLQTDSLPEELLVDSVNAMSLVSQNLVQSILNENDDAHDGSKLVFKESEVLTPGVELLWESEFARQYSDANEDGPNNNLLDNSDDDYKERDKKAHSGWRKLMDGNGAYYWNIETGATQYEVPRELENATDDSDLDTQHLESVDSSLAELEGAAFRYASLHIKDDDTTDRDDSSEWTVSSDTGRMFSVRSLGWLPMNECSSDPETSSANVNACIRHLSSSHGQIMDGIGSWGDGKNLMLIIEDEFLKLVDPTTQTVLSSQSIKHIRVWGVGRECAHDFAYVARDSRSRTYKCHVFRCDVSAKAIAHELHTVCKSLSDQHKKAELEDKEAEKEKLAMSTSIPAQRSEASTKFPVKYLGSKPVESVNGIQTIKSVIRDITTDNTALCEDATAAVSASVLLITSTSTLKTHVNCRMRYLSFMGIGDDISLFAFISVVGDSAHCHVLQCLPNAVKLALSVQEACMLRFQKVVDSKQVQNNPPKVESSRRSVRQFVKGIFSRKKTS